MDHQEQSSTPMASTSMESVVVSGVDGGIHFLRSVDVSRAKVIFLLGVMVYLLLSFIHYGKLASIKALESEKQRIEHLSGKPLLPPQPVDPINVKPQPSWYEAGENSKEFATDVDQYKEQEKVYQQKITDWKKKKRGYDKALAQWTYKKAQMEREELPLIEEKIQQKRAYLHAWSYVNHCLRFVAALLMAFGCMVLIFHGNPYERAVALFILGYVVVGILKIHDAVIIDTISKIG